MGKIGLVVRDIHKESSPLSITQFCNLIRFSRAAPQVAHLLRAGGMWTISLENAYSNLLKCRPLNTCADQAELINEAISHDEKEPYYLAHIIPGGDIGKLSNRDLESLGDGGDIKMVQLIEHSIYGSIKRVVWDGEPTVFGSKVLY